MMTECCRRASGQPDDKRGPGMVRTWRPSRIDWPRAPDLQRFRHRPAACIEGRQCGQPSAPNVSVSNDAAAAAPSSSVDHDRQQGWRGQFLHYPGSIGQKVGVGLRWEPNAESGGGPRGSPRGRPRLDTSGGYTKSLSLNDHKFFF